MRNILRLFLGIACSIGVLPAQPAILSGPVEGFTFDVPTGSLRALIGFPGSASFGPVALDSLDFGSVAPRKSYAIAFKQGNCLLVSGLGSDQVSTTLIPGVAGQPEGIAWSGDGTLAVLYSRSGNWIQTLTGLPDAVQAAPSVDVSSMSGSLSAVATDAKGKHVALATRGDAGGVYLMTDGQAFAQVLEMSKPIAMAFSDDAANLYVLDGAGQLAVLAVGDLSTQTLSLDGLQDPFAVRAGRDAENRPVVFVASRSDRLLRAYDPSTQAALATLPLNFQPTGIDDLGRNSFVIASRSNQGDPLWLLTGAPQLAVYFVPAAQPNSGGLQ